MLVTLTLQPVYIFHRAVFEGGLVRKVGPWLCFCRRLRAPPAANQSPQPIDSLVWAPELWRFLYLYQYRKVKFFIKHTCKYTFIHLYAFTYF